MRLLSEVILGQTIDVLKVSLFLLFIKTNSLPVAIHHNPILIAKLIHYIMVFLFLFVDKDRFQSSLRLLLEYFDYVLRLLLLCALRLKNVLEGSDGLETHATNLCCDRLELLFAISLEK